MLTTKNNQKGFTIVELLIVIVVIGILAALVINTFSGVQRKARNSERQTDLKAIASQLESCYNDSDTTNCTITSAYPFVITAGSSGSLKKLDPNAIKNPQGATDSIVYNGTAAAVNNYLYERLNTDGTNCTDPVPPLDGSESCPRFRLTSVQEAGAANIVINSLNQ